MSSTSSQKPPGQQASGVHLKPGFTLWRATERTSAKAVPASGQTAVQPAPALVLLFTWLFAKASLAFKYVELYQSRGFDVLHISCSVRHFLWPPSSVKFARQIRDLLKEGSCLEYRILVIHGMSVGAYNYNTCLMLADEDPEMKAHFLGRIRACVFDSLTLGTMENMMRGVATGASERELVRSALMAVISTYLRLTRPCTVDFYTRAADFYKHRSARVPTLVFASLNDPMSDVEHFRALQTLWKDEMKLPVTFQVWDESGHCEHLRRHRDQYVQALDDFLKSLKLNPVEENPVALKSTSKL